MALYLTPQTEKVRAVAEFDGINDSEFRLLLWLVFATNPRSGRVDGATISAIADELHWSRPKTARCLDVLRNEAGMVDFDLPHGAHRGGWVQVLAFYDIMAATKWLSRQRYAGER